MISSPFVIIKSLVYEVASRPVHGAKLANSKEFVSLRLVFCLFWLESTFGDSHYCHHRSGIEAHSFRYCLLCEVAVIGAHI